MRKTLHTLPLHLASFAHAATRDYRLRDTRRIAERSGVSEHDLLPLQRKIRDHLTDSASASHREIERAVTPSGASPIPARIALKLLWENGDLVYRNVSSVWLRESRSFSLSARTYPGFEPTLDRDSALDELIGHYFARYGPATVKDAAWWAAVGAKWVVRALAGLDTVQLRLPWASDTFWMLRADLETFLADRPTASHDVQLLGHEDVALKAYFESRSRYLGELPARRIFNQIGEVLPVLLHRGEAIGRWKWDPARRRITFRRFPAPANSATRGETAAAVARMEARLRQIA